MCGTIIYMFQNNLTIYDLFIEAIEILDENINATNGLRLALFLRNFVGNGNVFNLGII